MSDIQRYVPTSSHGGMIRVEVHVESKSDGTYVRYTDHAAEIDRLRAELDNAAAAAVANMSLACEKEREADALRVDAMRYRWLRESCQAAADEHATAGQLYFGTYLYGNLDAEIDAAAGVCA